MTGFEAVKQYAYPDEAQALRIKEMTEIAAGGAFANPVRTAKNAEILSISDKSIPRESLGLEPSRNNEGLRHALWTLNTYRMRLRPDGLLQPESQRGDWEVLPADRKLARVALKRWRVLKPGPMQYRENDVVGQYLAAIKGVELLSAEEEVELSKDIEAGLYATQKLEGGKAHNGEELSVEERKQYAEMALIGKDAYDHMYEANLRLVVNLARKYNRGSVPFEDLIQEGNLGLKHAIEKFDYRMGYKFSVYASRWIEQALQSVRATQSSHPIAITKHELQNLKKILKVMDENEKENHTDLSIEEISKRTKIRSDLVHDLLMNHYQSTLSLDKPITDNGSGVESSLTLADVLMDKDEILVEDEITEHDIQGKINEALTNALANLASTRRLREKVPAHIIIKELYGIGYNTSSNSTQIDVAQRLGLGRSAVAEAERFALEVLNKDEGLRAAILAKFPHAGLIGAQKADDEQELAVVS